MALFDLFRDEDLFPDFSSPYRSLLGNNLLRDVAKGTSTPAVSITENQDGTYVIDLAAPGLKRDDFKIAVEGGALIRRVPQDKINGRVIPKRSRERIRERQHLLDTVQEYPQMVIGCK